MGRCKGSENDIDKILTIRWIELSRRRIYITLSLINEIKMPIITRLFYKMKVKKKKDMDQYLNLRDLIWC